MGSSAIVMVAIPSTTGRAAVWPSAPVVVTSPSSETAIGWGVESRLKPAGARVSRSQ